MPGRDGAECGEVERMEMEMRTLCRTSAYCTIDVLEVVSETAKQIVCRQGRGEYRVRKDHIGKGGDRWSSGYWWFETAEDAVRYQADRLAGEVDYAKRRHAEFCAEHAALIASPPPAADAGNDGE